MNPPTDCFTIFLLPQACCSFSSLSAGTWDRLCSSTLLWLRRLTICSTFRWTCYSVNPLSSRFSFFGFLVSARFPTTAAVPLVDPRPRSSVWNLDMSLTRVRFLGPPRSPSEGTHCSLYPLALWKTGAPLTLPNVPFPSL